MTASTQRGSALLEPCDGKLSRTVPRRGPTGNRRSLFDDFPDDEASVEDDENDDLPQPICCDRYCDAAERPVQESDSDDIRDKDVPGTMKRFESDGFEVTVTLVPKNEFD